MYLVWNAGSEETRTVIRQSLKLTQTRTIKNNIFKQGIAEKAKKQEGIAWVVMLTTNPYLT